VQARDDAGQTALHKAAMNGWLDCIHLLLDQPVDVNSIDHAGRPTQRRRQNLASRGTKNSFRGHMASVEPETPKALKGSTIGDLAERRELPQAPSRVRGRAPAKKTILLLL